MRPAAQVPPPDLVRQLAVSVAARGSGARGLEILADNTGGSWGTIVDLVERGACFAVRVADDVLAIDADTPRAVETLRTVAARLSSRNIAYVHLESGGAGREHLFARMGSHLERTRLAKELRGRVDVRTESPIRPPGVVHRSGVTPRLLAPSSWEQALEILQPRRAAPPAAMSPALSRMLRDGDVEGRYRRDDGTLDPSRLAMAICNLAVSEGVSKQAVYDAMCDERNTGGESLRKRLRGDGGVARRWFDLTWWQATRDSPRRTVRSYDAEVVLELEEQLGVFLSQPHPGQRGNSRVAVFVAAVRLLQRRGSRQGPLSVRVLADASGKDPKTVCRTLRDLAELGWLEQVEQFHLDRAAIWSVPRVLPTGPSGPLGGSGSGGNLRVEVGHDGFANGALGVGGWRVLVALGEESLTPREIAEATGLCVGTVRQHLERLRACGMVDCDEGCWSSNSRSAEDLTVELEQVAVRRGTAGRRARRRRRFDRERQMLRSVLAGGDEGADRLAYRLGRRSNRLRIRYTGLVAGRRAA